MDWTPDGDALRGRVALVAGATRGAGRGIAASLGEAGATVICTGRSSVSGNAQSDYDRPETIEETAELVTELGGVGVPVQVDHLDIGQVRRLADRIRADHGAIDILVNDIWGAEVLKGGPPTWNRPIWEHDLDDGLRILRLGIDTHLITSHCLLPLLVARPGGLLIEVTDGTKAYNDDNYRLSVFYDLAKVAVNRLAYSHGHELALVRRHGRRGDAGLAALGDDARQLGCSRRELADGAEPEPARRARRPSGLRRIGDAALCRAWRCGDRRRREPVALEPALGHLRRTGARVRLHRHRRPPAGRLGVVGECHRCMWSASSTE